MYSNPGDLIVYAGERSANPNQADIFSGNKGEQWQTSIFVQIPQYSNAVVSIMGCARQMQHDTHLNRFVISVTRRVSLVEQDLTTYHLAAPKFSLV